MSVPEGVILLSKNAPQPRDSPLRIVTSNTRRHVRAPRVVHFNGNHNPSKKTPKARFEYG